jgi:hypothetical protein
MAHITWQQRRILNRFSDWFWAQEQLPNEDTEDYDHLIELGLLKRDPWSPTSYMVTDAGLAYDYRAQDSEDTAP